MVSYWSVKSRSFGVRVWALGFVRWWWPLVRATIVMVTVVMLPLLSLLVITCMMGPDGVVLVFLDVIVPGVGMGVVIGNLVSLLVGGWLSWLTNRSMFTRVSSRVNIMFTLMITTTRF